MSINVNGYDWIIEFVDADKMLLNPSGKLYFGLTEYDSQIISIRKGLSDRATKTTIMHELLHCFLYSYGFGDNFNEEELCNIFSSFADEILKITNDILNEIKGGEIKDAY